MSNSHEMLVRQTLFVIKEGPATKKITIPGEWNSARVFSSDQILSAFDRAQQTRIRLLILCGEDDFSSTMQLLKLRALKMRDSIFGIVVIVKDPLAFYKTAGLPPQILEAISEKDYRRDPKAALNRFMRQLEHAASALSRRIGPQTLERLNQIFIEMSDERDATKLLEKMLLFGMDLTQASAGTLYQVKENDGEMYFQKKVSSEDGQTVIVNDAKIRAVESSIAGYVALTGRFSNISDLRVLKPFTPPQYNRNIDHDSPIPPTTLLTVPFKNSRNENVALLQVVNKRGPGNEPVPFESDDESILLSFGTQAAVCMGNVDLYQDVQKLFEGFVRASVTAIESRDPSTGGHSERVAKMSVALARATTECSSGIYRSVRFKEEEIKELEYAALLHDFGKIGVREEVLVKAKKLYEHQLEAIHERIKICKAAARINFLERQLREGSVSLSWERQYNERIRQIESYWEIILGANEPAIVVAQKLNALEEIRSEKLLLPDGTEIALLTEEEFKALSVSKGTLTDSERMEIESHVRHTHQFLKMIPWTRDFKHLTEIAYCHHEKLDGSGYPRGLYTHEIPLQSKIMTISDIYDALTAADRWYKEAVPTERALDILGQEVAEGKIDPVLFEIFVERKIFLLTLPKLMHEVAG